MPISRTILYFFACLTTIIAYSNEETPPSSEICEDGKRHYRVALRHIESGGIGYNTG